MASLLPENFHSCPSGSFCHLDLGPRLYSEQRKGFTLEARPPLHEPLPDP